MLKAACAMLGLAALYALFAGSLSLDELVAAVLTATASTAWFVANRRATERHFGLLAPWHRILASTSLHVAGDAVRVGRVLARAVAGLHPGGTISWQRFHHGGPTAPDAGRRALSVLAVSLAPNGYVLDVPGEADAMLLHRLAPTPAQPDAQWPL